MLEFKALSFRLGLASSESSDVSIPWILATLAIGFGLSYLAWKLPIGSDKK